MAVACAMNGNVRIVGLTTLSRESFLGPGIKPTDPSDPLTVRSPDAERLPTQWSHDGTVDFRTNQTLVAHRYCGAREGKHSRKPLKGSTKLPPKVLLRALGLEGHVGSMSINIGECIFE